MPLIKINTITHIPRGTRIKYINFKKLYVSDLLSTSIKKYISEKKITRDDFIYSMVELYMVSKNELAEDDRHDVFHGRIKRCVDKCLCNDKRFPNKYIDQFKELLNATDDDVIHWKHNLKKYKALPD